MKELMTEDRGLGSAYERYCFYQLLDKWAAEYGVETLLEGPVDGMAGIAGVHGVGLARKGVKVTAVLPTEAHAEVTRAVYTGCGAAVETRIAGEHDVASLPQADMVVAYHALSFVEDWRSYVKALASRAKKVLVVSVCNPDNWGVYVMQALAKARGNWKAGPPENWKTAQLAPELWNVGRVRDHVYFDAPWWPDLPAFEAAGDAYAGRSVKDRLLKKVFGSREAGGASKDTALADKYVYGASRWPYFGGPGWIDDLLPALLKHPCFEGAPSPSLRKHTAHLHAFVVDMRPRTPQARRKLAQVGADP